MEVCTTNNLSNEKTINKAFLTEEVIKEQAVNSILVEYFKIAPNPFSYTSTINYNLLEATEVSLGVYSTNGICIKEFVKKQVQPNEKYQYNFEPSVDMGNVLYVVLVTEKKA